MIAPSPDSPIIIFDGHCNLCSGLITRIKKQDKDSHFQYVPLQGPMGKELFRKYKLDQINSDSIILIDHEGISIKSLAVFRIVRQLGGWWKIFNILKLFPLEVNDYLYDVVARNRFRFFGRREECALLEE